MMIAVDSVSAVQAHKLRQAGWREHAPESYKTGPLSVIQYEDILGQHMQKEFASMGEAIREFEAVTGEDVFSVTSQDGVPVYTFYCDSQQIAVAGWECGKYLFTKWHETPRQCLEALNAP